MADKIRLALSVALICAGIAGFYVLKQQMPEALVLRVLSVIVGVVLGGVFAWRTTEVGRRFVTFAKEAITETKKVVWPSRKETVQMTGIVFAFVVVVAIFLWLTDKSLEWVLYDLILGWK